MDLSATTTIRASASDVYAFWRHLKTSRRSWLILTMAEAAGCVPVDFEEVDFRSQLLELTGGRGPDKCIDAVWKPCTAAATDLPEMRADDVARHQH